MEWSEMLTDSRRLAAIRDYTHRRVSQILEDLSREIGVSPGARNVLALQSAQIALIEITAYWAAVNPDSELDVGPCALSPIPEADYVLGVARAQEVFERCQRGGEPLPPDFPAYLTLLCAQTAPDTEAGYYAGLALEKLSDAVGRYRP